MKLTLLGNPVAKARPRTVRLKSGKSITYTPDKTVAAENAWRDIFTKSGETPFSPDTPLLFMVTFYLQRPKSAPKKRVWPVKKPDSDNYEKLVMDALNGFAYQDDSAIVRKVTSKRFVTYPDPPRTELEIIPLEGC